MPREVTPGRRHAGAGSARENRRVLLSLLALALVVAAVVTATTVLGDRTPPPQVTERVSTPLVGTLGTRPSTAAEEAENGVDVGMLELRWADWETAPGVFSEAYQRQIVDQIDALRRAGLRVTLGLGLHYTPSWIRARPFVDDHGTRSEQADFVFDARNRAAAEQFLAHAATVIDFSQLWAVRISSGSRSELMYPQSGTWWAFSPGALGTAPRPDTVRANPFPTWRPGDRDALSETDRRRWYQWYLASLADTARWQMRIVQAHGFGGWFQILTPGSGVRPSQRDQLIEQGLPDGLAGEGVDWPEIYDQISRFGPAGRVVAYVTSVGDDSGGNVGCQPADHTVPLDAARTDSWSATRWIARIAAEHGFPVAGENPGYTASPEYQRQYRDDSADGLLATTFRLARECSFQAVYWAHDDQIWNGTVDRDRFWAQIRALPTASRVMNRPPPTTPEGSRPMNAGTCSATPAALRVGVDARVLDERYHGIGRSTFELLCAAADAHPQWHLVLFVNATQRSERFDLQALTSRPNVSTARFDHELTSIGQYLRWPKALRAADIDVALFPYHLGAALSGRARRFGLIHDCILEADPRFAPDRRTRLLYMLLTAAVVRRTHVLTPSRASADDIARIYRIRRGAQSFGVLRWGVGEAFGADVAAPAEVNGRPVGRPYLLHVGARRPHKNVGHLVRVLDRLPAEYRLVLVGSPDPRWPDDVDELIAAHGLGDRVLQPGKVSEADLIGLYAGAAAFVYPSLIEGFGLPLLEAFAAGTPVVAGDIPVFREVAQGAALLCPPDDPDAWAGAITSLAEPAGAGRRAELVAAGRRQAARATWVRAADDLARSIDPPDPLDPPGHRRHRRHRAAGNPTSTTDHPGDAPTGSRNVERVSR